MTECTECCPAYAANSDYPSVAFASIAAQIEQKIQQILDAMTPERIAGATLSQMAAALKTLATQAQAFHKIAATAAAASPTRRDEPKEHRKRAVSQLPTSGPERAESSDATPDAPGAARAAAFFRHASQQRPVTQQRPDLAEAHLCLGHCQLVDAEACASSERAAHSGRGETAARARSG